MFRVQVLLVSAFLACVVLSASMCGGQDSAGQLSGGVTRIRSVEDVIREWEPTKHVFVKGDLGIGARQLAELEEWMDENAPHWVVVLMEYASDERFRAADGRDYRGMDAVEFALGNSMSNRTNFGGLEHPLTKESDGAIFVLFLRERKFSYFASDAQDRRGLGEARWIGHLDQPAFRAMRGGGRILDAAKDTIKSINTRLNNAIQAEVNAEQRAERERLRAADALRRAVQIARQQVEEVKMEAANLRLQSTAASGALANPPLEQWKNVITAVEDEISPNTVRELDQKLNQVRDDIERYLNGYATLKGVQGHEQHVSDQLDNLEADTLSYVAITQITEARRLLRDTLSAARDGQLGIDELLSATDNALLEAEQRMDHEQARLQRAELRRFWIRQTIIFMCVLLVALIALALFILNIRRRPAMRRAQKELEDRRQSVRRETDGIDVLFVRCKDLLGSREQLQKRGYQGMTQQLCTQALEYVDDLFIMSKEVRRVLRAAQEMVYPSGLWGKLVNTFSSSRYLQAINEVSGKPLKFTRAGGLPLVLRDRAASPASGPLPDEISLTFEEVFTAFEQRGDAAENSLDTIETCLSEVNTTLDSLQHELEQTIERERQLAAASEVDQYFDLPNYFETLIPSVQEDLAQADQLAAFDAVQAMQRFVPLARRKIDEANTLADLLTGAREQLFPELKSAAEKLQHWGYPSDWIDTVLQRIAEHADQLMAQAAQASIADNIPQLQWQLDDVREQSQTSVRLATSIHEQHLPGLKSLSQRIEEVRAKLARQLKLSESQVLNEPQRDPDDYLATADQDLETARRTLALGRNDVVQSAIEAMLTAAERADAILNSSLAAIADFAQNQNTAHAELQRLKSRIPQAESELERIQQAYVSAAFSLPDPIQDESHVETKANVREAIQFAAAPCARLQQLLQSAEQEQMAGHVLRASDMHAEAVHDLASAHATIDTVEKHLNAIEVQARENLSHLSRLEVRAEKLLENRGDPLVMHSTLQSLSQARERLVRQREELSSSVPAPNPFEIELALRAMQEMLTQLDARCTADRQAHAEAARAAAGARRQWQAAEKLVRQSQTDGIPDSRLTTQLNLSIAGLAEQLAGVEAELRSEHADWRSVDDRASQLQVQLRTSTDALGGELQNASQALIDFQNASQAVYQAEQWSGGFGVRVTGSPGVHELERARAGLQQGDYAAVLELSQVAARTAQMAVQTAQREVNRRTLAAKRRAEAERRKKAARRQTFSIGSSGGFSSGRSSFGGGGGSSFRSGSGFSRSGW